MKDDDPEKRIRELERELADVTRTPPSTPPTGEAPYEGYVPPTGDAPYSANAPYAANAPYTANPPYTPNAPYTANTRYVGGSPYGFGVPPRRRRSPYLWIFVMVVLGMLVPIVFAFVQSRTSRSIFGSSPDNGPTAVPRGGELRVGGNSTNRTVACNDGKLTLYGYNSQYAVTGHCASLTVGGYNNNVTVDGADALESTGYNNVVTNHACNNGNLTVSSYSNVFNVTGHCATLTVKSYNNQVTVDSVDSITVSSYNNIVTYHSGAPKIADSGNSNIIQQG
jgi:hypothetical protein